MWTEYGWVPDELLGGLTSSGYTNYVGPGYLDQYANTNVSGDGTPIRTTTTLPPEYWPTPEEYERVAAAMRARGIEPPPIGTLSDSATQELGRALYEEAQSGVDWGIAGGALMMAALGIPAAWGAGPVAGAGAAAVPAGATIAPNGLLTGPVAAAGGGVGTLSGAVPAVGAAPGIGVGAGVATGLEVGPNGLPTGPASSAGGGVGAASGSIPAVGATPGVGAGGGMFENLLGGLSGNWPALIGGLLGAIDANNQPDSMTTNQGGTSTSTYGQTLPAEIVGPAGDALARLRSLVGGGYSVAGADPASSAALTRLQNLGINPFAGGGMLNTAPTASPFAGGATINPYLDSVFNTAANSTQNRLATEFARAGRLNSDSHQQARSQELQNLAAGIYGQGFESERARQYGAEEAALNRLYTQMEANLGRQYGAIEGNLGRDLSSVLPMLTIGDYMRGVQQQQLDAPWMNVQRYLTGLQGLLPFFPGSQTQSTEQTGSVTQPLFNNPWAGFLGGAQLGRLFSPGG